MEFDSHKWTVLKNLEDYLILILGKDLNWIYLFMQATLAAPLKGKMFKGLCLCYTVIVVTFFSVAISGYWTFGNEAKGTILANLMGHTILPSWFLIITNTFCLLQVSAVTGVRSSIHIKLLILYLVELNFFKKKNY